MTFTKVRRRWSSSLVCKGVFSGESTATDFLRMIFIVPPAPSPLASAEFLSVIGVATESGDRSRPMMPGRRVFPPEVAYCFLDYVEARVLTLS